MKKKGLIDTLKLKSYGAIFNTTYTKLHSTFE